MPDPLFPSFPGAGGTPLGESVRRLSLERPAEPALCFREGWDWRWWTWSELALTAQQVRASETVPERSETFGQNGDPADLAWLVAADAGAGPTSGPRHASVRDPEGAAGEADRCFGVPPLAKPGRWRRLMRVPSREIVVERAPGATAGRLGWLRWALGGGAAIVLAPAVPWLEVVEFARPTLLWGDGSEAEALLEHIRGRRRSVDRLRAFACVDASPLSEPVARRFAELAVRVLGVQRSVAAEPPTRDGLPLSTG